LLRTQPSLLAWPLRLSCFAQIALARGSLANWIAWTAVVAVAAIAAIRYRRQGSAFFLAAFAFVTLLPASNLLFPIGTIMAERLLYLPAIAFAGSLAAGVYAGLRRFRRPNLAPVVLGVVTALFAARTLVRNLDWQNDLTLASSTVRVSPNSFKAHKLMAGAFSAAHDSHANIDRVIEEADRSVAILDPVPDFRNNAPAFRAAAGYYLLKGDLQLPLDIDRDTPPPPAAQAAYLFRAVVVKCDDHRNVAETRQVRVNPERNAIPCGPILTRHHSAGGSGSVIAAGRGFLAGRSTTEPDGSAAADCPLLGYGHFATGLIDVDQLPRRQHLGVVKELGLLHRLIQPPGFDGILIIGEDGHTGPRPSSKRMR
jgi:hypothetical protein